MAPKAKQKKAKAPEMKDTILQLLTEMRNIEIINKQPFKVKAYNKAIHEIELVDSIDSMDDLEGVNGVGVGIRGKIMQIFETGTIKEVDAKKGEEYIMKELTSVHGIGPVKAKELYNKNIKSIHDLNQNLDQLNAIQKIGLKYHDDMQIRIPRKEMDKHVAFLGKVIDGTILYYAETFEVAGSYRRRLTSSGDIDLIVSSDEPKYLEMLVNNLKNVKYVVDILACGDKKFMGLVKLPRHKTYRRLDILIANPERYAFAILYFTGSQMFNIHMRNIALEQGYSLNEYGLTPLKNNKRLVAAIPQFRTEKDIFDFLKMEFVEPWKRIL